MTSTEQIKSKDPRCPAVRFNLLPCLDLGPVIECIFCCLFPLESLVKCKMYPKFTHYLAMGQNPNPTPSEHPNPTTKIGSKMYPTSTSSPPAPPNTHRSAPLRFARASSLARLGWLVSGAARCPAARPRWCCAACSATPGASSDPKSRAALGVATVAAWS